MPCASELSAPPPLSTLLEAGNIALFLDFDGTLVELAPTPDTIAPVAGLADRLAMLDQRIGGRCALVSGRAIADIEGYIGAFKLAAAGSHGSDVRDANGASLGEGAQTLPEEIEQALRQYAAQNGVDYEHKPHGGALHYRSNPEGGEGAIAFAKSLAEKHGWKAQEGKCVIEIVADAGDKGTAVCAFMDTQPFSGARAFFIGDDLTDEAGFAACKALGGAGILVGERKETRAQFRLPDVTSVHKWLEI